MRTLSIVTGILSLLLCWLPIVGIVLGVIAICAAKKNDSPMNGLDTAGFVCGIVGVVLSGLMSVGSLCTGALICASNY